MQPCARLLFVATGLLLAVLPARAVTLDWDTASWSAGSLTNSYNVDAANPGNDITISMSDPNSRRVPDPTTNVASPVINNTLSGGLSPVQNNLKFAVDFAAVGETITITISFSATYAQGVQGVSFSLFDLDAVPADEVDQVVSISATDGVSTFAPTITGVGSAVSLTNTGSGPTLTGNTDANDTGAGSSNGNATISFGATAIRSLSFTFAAGPGTRNNPLGQTFGLSDITFSPVPEMNPACAAAIATAVAGVFSLWQRRRARAPRAGHVD